MGQQLKSSGALSMKQSSGEREFLYFWRVLGLPDVEWVEQYRFHPTRRWRFDFALPEQMIAVEVDGGTWQRGKRGHTSGAGHQRDCEKSNAAIECGWRVLRYTPKMLKQNPDECINQIKRIISGA
jgi:very-short-patch-repair endonuclease